MSATLRGRVATALVVVAALSVAITALTAYRLLQGFIEEEAIRQLRRDAAVLSRQPLDEGEPVALRLPPRLHVAQQLLAASGNLFAHVDPEGRVVAGDRTAAAIAARVLARRPSGGASGTIQSAGTTYAYVLFPVAHGPRGPRRAGGGAVVLARPASLAGDVLRPVAARVAAGGAVAVLVALAVSVVVARRLSARVNRLAEATESIAAGDLEHRVPVEGDDEIASLARGFNAMVASLSEARRREREFLASVSHELRTPVTAIRGYAGAIADGTAASPQEQAGAIQIIDLEAERLERLVQDVIDLARLGSNEFRLERSVVDLGGTLEEAARAHAAHAADAGVRLETDIDGPLPATTDAARVRQIVSNLVENALRVVPTDGVVRISGRTSGPSIVIEVADTGPGIAPADLPHAFERGYLWNAYKSERRVGSGLGLAIVRELATALGGGVEVASERGRGTTFRLTLPA